MLRRRDLWRVTRIAGAFLIIVLSAGELAQARDFFTPPRPRKGDRAVSYTVARATSTVVVRWQVLCPDSDAVCRHGRFTYRDRVLDERNATRGLIFVRRRPSFRSGRGALLYDRDASWKLLTSAVGGRDCTQSMKLALGGSLQKTMTYSMVLADGEIRVQLESLLMPPEFCAEPPDAPPHDSTLRSLDIVPTFSLPLARLAGRRITLDLRDVDRPFNVNRVSGTMTSRLRVTLVRFDR